MSLHGKLIYFLLKVIHSTLPTIRNHNKQYMYMYVYKTNWRLICNLYIKGGIDLSAPVLTSCTFFNLPWITWTDANILKQIKNATGYFRLFVFSEKFIFTLHIDLLTFWPAFQTKQSLFLIVSSIKLFNDKACSTYFFQHYFIMIHSHCAPNK